MRWTPSLSDYLAKLIIKEWSANSSIQFKAEESNIMNYIHKTITADLNKEKLLDIEVEQMITQLESTHSGQFERYKMYPLLKKEMAKKKGIIL